MHTFLIFLFTQTGKCFSQAFLINIKAKIYANVENELLFLIFAIKTYCLAAHARFVHSLFLSVRRRNRQAFIRLSIFDSYGASGLNQHIC